MSNVEISGVFAALLTPRNGEGSVDVPALRRLVHFLTKSGSSSFAVNGATGEFCLTSPAELRTMLSTVRARGEGKARILCCVGGAGAAQSIELARVAESEEADGLLLPMPYFYPYAQEDLDLFCRTVAGTTRLPVLLYNLPQFTSGLDKETVSTLVREVPNIIGIKDSSGSLEILRYLTQQGVRACRIVGSDAALAPALREGICDGVVSGIAGVVPEAILALYARRHQIESEGFVSLSVGIEVACRGARNPASHLLIACHSPSAEERQQLVAWFMAWSDKGPPAAG
jgi:4-hydroxy-tetrahydrodipicolinate synthase